MASFVTIERTYLETLMRRAGCHFEPPDVDLPPYLLTVTILKSEHEDLLRRCREYENLKQALYRGGIPHSSLETLIRGPDFPQTVQPVNGHYQADPITIGTAQATSAQLGDQPLTRSEVKPRNNDITAKTSDWQPQLTDRNRTDNFSRHTSPETDHTTLDPSDEKGVSPVSGDECSSSDPHVTGLDYHTVALKNLPERATHRDIVDAVRGGALVDIFLRPKDRMASVTFADAKAANEYLTYVKRRNVYILGKPIDASWSERQFHFPAYMSAQLSHGASRNLVIRGVHPDLTEDRIRADLDHIHNLIIINITYSGGNAYISTNSVQKASFARTCMRSRVPYNSLRIEYYPDECAEPLPKVQTVSRREVPQPVTRLNPMANRFEMLSFDEPEDDSDEQEELTSCISVAGEASWTTPSIAV